MIKPETIQKATNCLNDFNSFLLHKTYISTKEIDVIAKKHRVSNDIFYFAVNCGFIRKLGESNYESRLIKFEPIHARKAIEARNAKYSPLSHIKSPRLKRNQQNKPLVKKVLPKGVHRFDVRQMTPEEIKSASQPIKPLPKPAAKYTTISFLWGLFKIKY